MSILKAKQLSDEELKAICDIIQHPASDPLIAGLQKMVIYINKDRTVDVSTVVNVIGGEVNHV